MGATAMTVSSGGRLVMASRQGLGPPSARIASTGGRQEGDEERHLVHRADGGVGAHSTWMRPASVSMGTVGREQTQPQVVHLTGEPEVGRGHPSSHESAGDLARAPNFSRWLLVDRCCQYPCSHYDLLKQPPRHLYTAFYSGTSTLAESAYMPCAASVGLGNAVLGYVWLERVTGSTCKCASHQGQG